MTLNTTAIHDAIQQQLDYVGDVSPNSHETMVQKHLQSSGHAAEATAYWNWVCTGFPAAVWVTDAVRDAQARLSQRRSGLPAWSTYGT